jgi:hypothetical protein
MGKHIDTSDARDLVVDLAGAPGRIRRKAPAVMKRGALEVKRGMADDFSGHRYAGRVPASLEFEQRDALGLVYEVGELDSAGPQWGIAAILAYGTSNNAPVVDHTAALRREVPAIERHLGDAGEEAALGNGQ